MEQGHASGMTAKAEQTRSRILDTALDMFAHNGYEKTTMREIAAAAHCSLGLAYRYFESKEDMVGELYQRLARDLDERVIATLPAGSIADRFQQAMMALFEMMSPYRDTLGAIFGPALKPNAKTGVFSASNAGIRKQTRMTYVQLVRGSKDAPRAAQVGDVATVLYGMHLALVLFWLQDLSPQERKTYELLQFLRDMIALLRPLLKFSLVSQSLVRLVRIVGSMLGDESADEE